MWGMENETLEDEVSIPIDENLPIKYIWNLVSKECQLEINSALKTIQLTVMAKRVEELEAQVSKPKKPVKKSTS